MNVQGDRFAACDEAILRVSIADGKWIAYVISFSCTL